MREQGAQQSCGLKVSQFPYSFWSLRFWKSTGSEDIYGISLDHRYVKNASFLSIQMRPFFNIGLQNKDHVGQEANSNRS